MSGRETDFAAWIEKAEHDLLVIENNLAAERVTPPISIVRQDG